MPDSNEIIFFNKGKLDAVNIKKKTRVIIAEKGVRNVFNISADGSWLVYGSMKEGTTDLTSNATAKEEIPFRPSHPSTKMDIHFFQWIQSGCIISAIIKICFEFRAGTELASRSAGSSDIFSGIRIVFGRYSAHS